MEQKGADSTSEGNGREKPDVLESFPSREEASAQSDGWVQNSSAEDGRVSRAERPGANVGSRDNEALDDLVLCELGLFLGLGQVEEHKYERPGQLHHDCSDNIISLDKSCIQRLELEEIRADSPKSSTANLEENVDYSKFPGEPAHIFAEHES